MGLGLNPKGSGISAAKFFASAGAKVTVTDLKTKKELAPSLKLLKNLPTCHAEAPKERRRIKYVLGRHNEEDFENADLVIKNPGVRRDSPYLQAAQKNGVQIESDISFFLKNCPAPIIGITGTRGKSTTTALIGEMLKKKYKSVFVGGNIQMSPLNFIEKIKSDSLASPKPLDGGGKVVLELSSWMLEDALGLYEITKEYESTKSIKWPHIAVLTNIMPDHLNTYKSFKDYIAAKALIFRNQTEKDFAVLNYDDKKIIKLSKNIRARKIWFSFFPVIPAKAGIHKVFIKNKEIYFDKEKIIMISATNLLGEHNIKNILAAVAVAKIEGVSNQDIKKVLKSFRGLPNRLEFIRAAKGIKFYNDTTSTMPEATIAALTAIGQPKNQKTEKRKNIVLIAGGSDKGLDYKKLGQEIKKYCKAVVLFKGEASEKILKVIKRWNLGIEVRRNCHSELVSESITASSQTLKQVQGDKKRSLLIIENVNSMKDAVKNAMKLAEKGDIVLLSPGAASFGLFANEFDRGEQFKKIVKIYREFLCPVIQPSIKNKF